MLRLLFDQNLNQNILRGLISRIPSVDVVTAAEVGLSAASDTEILAWAATQQRVTVTHDYKTMPGFAAQIMDSGGQTGGLILISQKLATRDVLGDLEVIVLCSEQEEWTNFILYLPIR